MWLDRDRARSRSRRASPRDRGWPWWRVRACGGVRGSLPRGPRPCSRAAARAGLARGAYAAEVTFQLAQPGQVRQLCARQHRPVPAGYRRDHHHRVAKHHQLARRQRRIPRGDYPFLPEPAGQPPARRPFRRESPRPGTPMSGLHQQRQADKKAQGLLDRRGLDTQTPTRSPAHGQTTACHSGKPHVRTPLRSDKP